MGDRQWLLIYVVTFLVVASGAFVIDCYTGQWVIGPTAPAWPPASVEWRDPPDLDAITTMPQRPANGNLWKTAAGIYAHFNGETYGPWVPVEEVKRSSISATDEVALKKLAESLSAAVPPPIGEPTLVCVGDGKNYEPSADICTGDEIVLSNGRQVRYKGLATLRIAVEEPRLGD